MLDRLRAVPGVREAALSQPALLTGNVNGTDFFVQGRAYPARQPDGINRLVVSPNFFALMGIPVIKGRAFTEAENTASAPKVAVINDAAARKYFPNESPVGRRFGPTAETSAQLEIVGVVRDTKYESVREAAAPTMFVPHLQTRMFGPTFTVRTAGDPLATIGGIREAVRQIDPNLPIANVSTQVEQVEQRFLQERVFAQAYTLFGGLALLLAAIGLFGLMSYSVARRTNEIGIRMALGAQARDVLTLVMRESMVLVIVGVAIGLGIALAAGRFVASLLFGVAATDTVTMLVAVTVMVTVSAFAGFMPARRASRVDPMVALRYE
jgi:predicted permease